MTFRRFRPLAAAIAVATIVVVGLGSSAPWSWAQPEPPSNAAPAASPSVPRTVVWISLDGVRADYLDRGKLPFFERLRNEGAWSRQLRPAFPPVTFPSHCSQATGVPVERHGVTGNSFYDTGTRREARYPAEAALLQAEPIWLTAAAQGVRTLVYDWPLSQNQGGVVRAVYSAGRFDDAPSDEQRLDHLLDTWREDARTRRAGPGGDDAPLRLLMGYVHAADAVGHVFGPDAPEITPVVEKLDATLARFFDAAQELWRADNPRGELVLLLTTDHGMSRVDHLVNLEKALGLPRRLSAAGPPGPRDPVVVQGGSTGHVFVPAETPTMTPAAMLAGWEEKLRAFPFLKVCRRENLPAAWGYRHPTRTGDLVVFCARGYTFDPSTPTAVTDTAPGKLHGMHGYAVEDDPEMLGPMFLWCSGGDHGGGRDLGEVRWDQLHPTVARLLGIKPAEGATGRALLVE